VNYLYAEKGKKALISKRWFWFLGMLEVVFLLAMFSQSALAQGTFGSLVGNVTDPSGGSIPGANVKIILTSTNDTRAFQTDNAGAYTIATLIPGVYRVEVSKEGFRTFVAADILVNQNNVVRVDATLQVGAQAERIEVTTTATAELQTERADIHAEIATAALLELPQPNRTYEGLLELIPGTAPPAGQLMATAKRSAGSANLAGPMTTMPAGLPSRFLRSMMVSSLAEGL
jgi:hypothetical protein